MIMVMVIVIGYIGGVGVVVYDVLKGLNIYGCVIGLGCSFVLVLDVLDEEIIEWVVDWVK